MFFFALFEVHTLAPQTQLTENLKSIRESKAPLTEIKNSLQEEINNSNRAINTLSEEVTLIKQKVIVYCHHFLYIF